MTQRDRLLKIANRILSNMNSKGINPDNLGWDHIEAYKTTDLKLIYKNFGKDFVPEGKKGQSSDEPSLRELNNFAYSIMSEREMYPDYLFIAPIEDKNIIIGYLILNAVLLGPNWNLHLIDVFSDKDSTKQFIQENWFLDEE